MIGIVRYSGTDAGRTSGRHIHWRSAHEELALIAIREAAVESEPDHGGPSAGASGGDRRSLGASRRRPTLPRSSPGPWRSSRVRYAVAASFQDAVLVDLAVGVDPRIEIDLPRHRVPLPRDARLRRATAPALRPQPRWSRTPRSAATSSRAARAAAASFARSRRSPKPSQGRSGWITGLKRVDTPERADAPIIAWDPSRNMVKVNPLATWTDDDVDAYVAEHDLPRHPLNYVGYVSIGCAPTTQPGRRGPSSPRGPLGRAATRPSAGCTSEPPPPDCRRCHRPPSAGP